MIDAPITALAPWYGSKRTIAPQIAKALGDHHAYFEPFCGSMAVLFEKDPVRHEVVNDLNRDLVNVATVLQDRSDTMELIERLHYTLAAEETFRAAKEYCKEPHAGYLGDTDRAYHALVMWWLGRNGVAGTVRSRTSFCARFTAKGGSGSVRFRSLIDSIPAFVERLARVDVLNRDGFEVVEKIGDEPGTAVYLDPPYLAKSAEYEHDFQAEDHKRLADAVARFTKARVVVSYYPHPRLQDLYPPDRWDWVPIDVQKNIANSSSRKTGGNKATELLLVNKV